MSKTRRRRDLIVTYASQLYMTAIAIVMLPFYVRLLGVERYGIIALAVALQGVLALLDLGLSSTVTRQAANFRAGAEDGGAFRALVKLVERVFLAIGLVLALAALVGAEVIARQWLKAESLDIGEMALSIRLIGVMLMFRFLCIPWRALQTGSEDFVALAGINVVATTLRSVGVLGVLAIVGPSLTMFFAWQVAIGGLEFAALFLRGRTLLPPVRVATAPLAAVRDHWRFSLSFGSAAIIWVAISNADKLILSGLLPLADYAVFSVATVAANAVMLLVGPFAMALGPGMMRSHAEGDRAGLGALYDRYSQLVATFAIASSLLLALFPYQLVWAWTGKGDIAGAAAPVLRLYALGNGALAIGALPLQLQAAAGRLRWHIAGSVGFGLLFLPLLFIATRSAGMVGAAAAWLGINFVFAGLWLPFLHHHFYPGRHSSWLMRNVLPVLVPTVAAGGLMAWLAPWPEGRIATIAELAGVGAVLLAVAVLSARENRRDVYRLFRSA